MDDEQSSSLRASGPEVRSMYITPNGHWLALVSEHEELQVWNLDAGSVQWMLPVIHGSHFVLTPEGDRVIFAHRDFSLRIWNLRTNKLVRALRGHSARINDVALTSDGKRMASAADDSTVKIWDISGVGHALPVRREDRTGRHAARVTALTVTPDGEHVLSGSVDGVRVRSIQSGTAEQTIAEQDGWVDRIEVGSDGNRVTVLSSRGYGQVDMHIIDASDQHHIELKRAYHWWGVRIVGVYDGTTWQQVDSMRIEWGDKEEFKTRERDPTRAINQFGVITTSVPSIFIGDQGNGYKESLMYFTHEGPERQVFAETGPANPFANLILAADGSRMVLYDKVADGFRVTQTDHQNELPTIEFASEVPMYLRAVSPDGRYMILAVRNRLLVVGLQTLGAVPPFEDHNDEVYEVTVTPNSQKAVSLSADGTCAIWGIGTTQKRILRSEGRGSIKTITSDSRRAILAWPNGDMAAIPLELDNGGKIHALYGHTARVNDAAATRDGHKLVSVSDDHTIRMWSLQSGQQLASLTLDHPLEKVAFGLDGEVVVVGDAVGDIYCLRFQGKIG
jgi:WD40 repeat protein